MTAKLRLQVGKTYISRNGEGVTIVSADGSPSYPYKGDDTCSYMKDGGFLLDATSGFDLIREKVSLEVGKKYMLNNGWIVRCVDSRDGGTFNFCLKSYAGIYWARRDGVGITGIKEYNVLMEYTKEMEEEDMLSSRKNKSLKVEDNVGKFVVDGGGDVCYVVGKIPTVTSTVYGEYKLLWIDSDGDAVEVYQYDGDYNNFISVHNTYKEAFDSLKRATKLTVAEVEEKLGYKVEIISE